MFNSLKSSDQTSLTMTIHAFKNVCKQFNDNVRLKFWYRIKLVEVVVDSINLKI